MMEMIYIFQNKELEKVDIFEKLMGTRLTIKLARIDYRVDNIYPKTLCVGRDFWKNLKTTKIILLKRV